jgi:hypothetical protein
MDFADEHYVKMFPRDTVTWRRWPWQAKALLWPLLRKLTKAGVLNIGTRGEPHVNVALMVEMPEEVVEVGLRAYLDDGTVELHDGNVVVPKFLEAQESRKTKAATARAYREKQRDVARAKSSGFLEPTVTKRDQPLPTVTNGDPPSPSPSPSPARPLPDPVPELLAPRKRDAGKVAKEPDPRHHPLKLRLMEAFKRKRHGDMPWDGHTAKVLDDLLGMRARDDLLWPVTLLSAFERALLATHPDLKSLSDFKRDLIRYIGTGPPEKRQQQVTTGLTGEGPITATEGTL